MDRLRERPYGPKCAVGIEATLVPLVSPGLWLPRVGYTRWRFFGFMRIETPVAGAFRAVIERTLER